MTQAKKTTSPNRINKNFVWGLDIKYENWCVIGSFLVIMLKMEMEKIIVIIVTKNYKILMTKFKRKDLFKEKNEFYNSICISFLGMLQQISTNSLA